MFEKFQFRISSQRKDILIDSQTFFNFLEEIAVRDYRILPNPYPSSSFNAVLCSIDKVTQMDSELVCPDQGTIRDSLHEAESFLKS
jgi:hypothetical protein